MKILLPLLLPTLTHANLSCPTPLGHEYPISSTLTMYFDVVLSSPDIESGSILCARLESLTTGWIGFGINPTRGMVGAEAVIGIPANNTVKKYILFGKDVNEVTEMPEVDQTLMDTSVTQDEEGRTTMTFTKYLFEDKYGILPNQFINSFIWAVGSSNELGYHSARGNFGMDLLTTLEPVETPAPSPTPTGVVTTSSGATEGKDGGMDELTTVAAAATEGQDENEAEATTPSTAVVQSTISVEAKTTVAAAQTTVAGAETTAAAEDQTAPVTETQTTVATMPQFSTASATDSPKTASDPSVVTTPSSAEAVNVTENAEDDSDDEVDQEVDEVPSGALGFKNVDSSDASTFEVRGLILGLGLIFSALLQF